MIATGLRTIRHSFYDIPFPIFRKSDGTDYSNR